MGAREPGQALRIRVRVRRDHLLVDVPAHHKALARDQVERQLRGARIVLVIVGKHVGAATPRGRIGCVAQELHRQIPQLSGQHGVAQAQVAHDGIVDQVLVVLHQETIALIAQLGPLAEEELQHLAQALGLQAARLHVLHEDALLEVGQQTRVAPGERARLGAGQHLLEELHGRAHLHLGGAGRAACRHARAQRVGGAARCRQHQQLGGLRSRLEQMRRTLHDRLGFARSRAPDHLNRARRAQGGARNALIRFRHGKTLLIKM